MQPVELRAREAQGAQAHSARSGRARRERVVLAADVVARCALAAEADAAELLSLAIAVLWIGVDMLAGPRSLVAEQRLRACRVVVASNALQGVGARSSVSNARTKPARGRKSKPT
jgi:hypothetical protein